LGWECSVKDLERGFTMKKQTGRSSGIELLVKKYKEAFRISENTDHYSESDYQTAERKYLKYALTGRI
jgi:hypothetical protein